MRHDGETELPVVRKRAARRPVSQRTTRRARLGAALRRWARLGRSLVRAGRDHPTYRAKLTAARRSLRHETRSPRGAASAPPAGPTSLTPSPEADRPRVAGVIARR